MINLPAESSAMLLGAVGVLPGTGLEIGTSLHAKSGCARVVDTMTVNTIGTIILICESE